MKNDFNQLFREKRFLTASFSRTAPSHICCWAMKTVQIDAVCRCRCELIVCVYGCA